MDSGTAGAYRMPLERCVSHEYDCDAIVPESTYTREHRCLKRLNVLPVKLRGKTRHLCPHHRAVADLSRLSLVGDK